MILMTASLALTANAQQKYIVANSYTESGCKGQVSSISSFEAGRCYNYAEERCGGNPESVCDYFGTKPLSANISFVASCKNGTISFVAYNRKGCNSSPYNTTINLYNPTCLKDFKLVCSDDPKYNSSSSNETNATTSNPNGVNKMENSGSVVFSTLALLLPAILII